MTWAEFGNLHPFAPAEQSEGYRQLTDELEAMPVPPPATTPCRCSPTPAPRASTPACWRSVPTTRAAATASATSV
ncbi:hypothetical protein ACPA9J_18780 [Pseudomonas aeruginosa]